MSRPGPAHRSGRHSLWYSLLRYSWIGTCIFVVVTGLDPVSGWDKAPAKQSNSTVSYSLQSLFFSQGLGAFDHSFPRYTPKSLLTMTMKSSDGMGELRWVNDVHRRSQRIPRDRWDEHKEELGDLYGEMSLDDLMVFMEETYNFAPR